MAKPTGKDLYYFNLLSAYRLKREGMTVLKTNIISMLSNDDRMAKWLDEDLAEHGSARDKDYMNLPASMEHLQTIRRYFGSKTPVLQQLLVSIANDLKQFFARSPDEYQFVKIFTGIITGVAAAKRAATARAKVAERARRDEAINAICASYHMAEEDVYELMALVAEIEAAATPDYVSEE